MVPGGGVGGVNASVVGSGGIWRRLRVLRHGGTLCHAVVSAIAILRHRIMTTWPATFYHAYPFYGEPPVPTSQQR